MKIQNNIDFRAVANQIKKAIKTHGNIASKQMENEAKLKAPWKDITSDARESIQGSFNWKKNNAVITLSGGSEKAFYFTFLELAYGKKYAILKPTIERHAAETLQGYEKMVNG